MSNKCRIKMIAGILAAMMAFCVVPMTAMATEPVEVVESNTTSSNPTEMNISSEAFVINKVAIWNDNYVDGNNNKIDLNSANRSTSYTMILKVWEDDAEFPTDTTNEPMIFELPAKIASAENGSYGDVQWVYDQEENELLIRWTNGKKNSFEARVTVTISGGYYPLYNLAYTKINNKETYYRLAKTDIKIEKPYNSYSSGVLNQEYEIEEYDFTGISITVNGITYEYADEDYKPDPNNFKPYYTAHLAKVEVVYNKIGGTLDDKKTPRWLISKEKQYDDPNTQGGFHANYKINLVSTAEEQTLYNFLNIDNKYYRLKKTTIFARPVKEYVSGDEVAKNEYTMLPEEEYDFTNLKLTHNKKEYSYSPVEKTGKYENYYTVTLEVVRVKDRIHSDAKWYTNANGWLDGAEETYNNEPNFTFAYHRDYIAEFHDGNAVFYDIVLNNNGATETIRKPADDETELPVPVKEGFTFTGWNTAEDGTGTSYLTLVPTGDTVLYAQWREGRLEINARSEWPEGKIAYYGAEITMTSELIGFENKTYTLQWQHRMKDGDEWVDQPGATEREYTYILDETNANYIWRIVARDIKDKE